MNSDSLTSNIVINISIFFNKFWSIDHLLKQSQRKAASICSVVQNQNSMVFNHNQNKFASASCLFNTNTKQTEVKHARKRDKKNKKAGTWTKPVAFSHTKSVKYTFQLLFWYCLFRVFHSLLLFLLSCCLCLFACFWLFCGAKKGLCLLVVWLLCNFLLYFNHSSYCLLTLLESEIHDSV